jgi:hypothetical protein
MLQSWVYFVSAAQKDSNIWHQHGHDCWYLKGKNKYLGEISGKDVLKYEALLVHVAFCLVMGDMP